MLFVSFSRNFGQLKIMSFLCVLGHLKRPDNLEIQFPFNKLIYRKGFGFFFVQLQQHHQKQRIESTVRQIGEIINLTANVTVQNFLNAMHKQYACIILQ